MKSIIQTDGTYCFLCRCAIGTDTHHIFGGPNRKWSDQDGLTVRLCRRCHEDVHSGQYSKPLMDALHELGQTQYEAAGHTREEFMKRYGRNYL